MRVDQAKSIHLRDLLSCLGYEPQRQVNGEWWYNSPFREETEASFKVSRDGKAWYDHGAGVGGNILKFICQYHSLSDNDISSALGKLDALSITHVTNMGDPSSLPAQPSLWENTHQRAVNAPRASNDASDRVVRPEAEDEGFRVTRIQPLQSFALITYLKERGIEKETARPWVQEMHYQRNGKSFYSLAFQSRSGGYELRNLHFKGAQGRKDITILNQESRAGECAVFEGFMDFLSWMQHTGDTKPDMPVMILNSVGMKKRAVEAIQDIGVEKVYLYPDHDQSGQDLARYMQDRLEGIDVVDKSPLYASFHDYNEFLIQNRKAACIA